MWAPASKAARTTASSAFKILNSFAVLAMAARASRQLSESHRFQFAPHCRLVQRDAEFLEDPLYQILQPPAHDAVDRRDRPVIHLFGQCLTLSGIQLRRLPQSLALNQSVRPLRVEAQNPVPNNLQANPT